MHGINIDQKYQKYYLVNPSGVILQYFVVLALK